MSRWLDNSLTGHWNHATRKPEEVSERLAGHLEGRGVLKGSTSAKLNFN